MGNTLFYDAIVSNPKASDDEYIVRVIKRNGNTSEFYELCTTYLDLALNNEWWIDENTGELKGSLNDADINIAKIATLKFV